MKGANARTRAAEIAWRFRANPMSSRGVQELGDAIMGALCELEGERDEWKRRYERLRDLSRKLTEVHNAELSLRLPQLATATAQLAVAKKVLAQVVQGYPRSFAELRQNARDALVNMATLDKYGAAPYPPSHAEQETVAQASQEGASPEAPAPSAADHTDPP